MEGDMMDGPDSRNVSVEIVDSILSNCVRLLFDEHLSTECSNQG